MVKVNCSEFGGLKSFHFSSNLTIFDPSRTQWYHRDGKFVKYDKKLLVIGGWGNAAVEEFNHKELSWKYHEMSPVNGLSILASFTALSIEKSLFIFGKWRSSNSKRITIFQEDELK